MTTSQSITDEARAIRRFWKPDGKIRRERDKQIKSWMKKNEVGFPDVSTFLYLPQLQNYRTQMVRDFSINLLSVRNAASSKAIRKFWKPDGEISPKNEAALRAAMRKTGVKEFSIANLLYNPILQKQHPAIVKALKLRGG